MDPDPASFLYSIDFEFLFGILAIVVLLACSAFISGSEVALFSLSQKDVDEILNKDFNKGTLISRLLEKPKKLLATILVANNFVNIAIVIIFSSFSGRLFNGIESSVLRFVLEVVVVTFFILLFGEVLPKIYANRNNMDFSQKVVIPISILNNVLSPISVPMRNGILFIEKKLNVQKGNFSVNQLSQALELTSQSDTTDGEQKILEGIVTFGNTEVRQVMSPRIDVFALNIEETFEEIMPKIVEKGYSRIPVYEDSIDNIIGLFYTKEIMREYIKNKDIDLKEFLREAFFVVGSKKISDLLNVFQLKKQHLAIVIDEFGGTEGILTLEDILEELVGEIQDEDDDEDKIVEIVSKNSFWVKATQPLEEINECLPKPISEGMEYNTLAGFILHQLEDIPEENQEFDIDDYHFKILKMNNKSVEMVELVYEPKKTEESIADENISEN